MPRKVDAVIAALKIVLADVERSGVWNQNTRDVNRWINQLPGALFGRWRNLKLRGDIERQVDRAEFIRHVRATLAYLETNRDSIASSWWRFSRGKLEPSPSVVAEPVDADYEDVPAKVHTLPAPRSRTRKPR